MHLPYIVVGFWLVRVIGSKKVGCGRLAAEHGGGAKACESVVVVLPAMVTERSG